MVTVLLVVVWIGSLWRYVSYGTPDWFASVGAGNVALVTDAYHAVPEMLHGVQVRTEKHEVEWWPVVSKRVTGWHVRLPFWTAGVPVLLITAAAWRCDAIARRRARLNLCPNCHYDLTGLARGGGGGAVCPECGEVSGGIGSRVMHTRGAVGIFGCARKSSYGCTH